MTFKILGPRHFEKWRREGRIGHGEDYWREHDTWLDCRGPLTVHPSSRWGYHVTVVTASHGLRPEDDFRHLFRPVAVEAGAWVCSNALLYNCVVGEGAIVAAGCVVRSRDVPPFVMVEGNPAVVVAERDREGNWHHLDEPSCYPLPTHARLGKRGPRLTMEDVQEEFD